MSEENGIPEMSAEEVQDDLDAMLADIGADGAMPVTPEVGDQELVDSLSEDTTDKVEEKIEEKVDQVPKSHRTPREYIKYQDKPDKDLKASNDKDTEPSEEVIESTEVEGEVAAAEGELEEIIEYEDEDGNPVNEDGTPLSTEKEEVIEDKGELASLREQVIALQGIINESASVQQVAPAPVPIPNAPSPPPIAEPLANAPLPTPEPVPIPNAQLSPNPLTQEVMDSILGGDPDALAGYINQASSIIVQNKMMEIRPIMDNMFETRTVFDNFFASPANRDLLPVIEFVKQRSIEVESNNQGKKLNEILELTAQAVREQLGFVKQVQDDVVETEEPGIVRRRITKRRVPTGKNGGAAPGNRARRTVTVKKAPENTVADEIEMMMGNDRR